VAVAARRVNRSQVVTPPKRSIFGRLCGILLHLLSIAVGVVAVLALMSPKDSKPKAPPMSQAISVQMARTLASSRVSPATLSEEMINSYLLETGRITWVAPVPGIPVPEWVSSEIALLPGEVTFRVRLTMFGYPLVFSETFGLEGRPSLYALSPRSGSIGLLPLKSPFLFPDHPLHVPMLRAVCEGTQDLRGGADAGDQAGIPAGAHPVGSGNPPRT